jgi:starvation-inducible DNA-binding protein
MAKTYPTKNDLPADVRATMADLLNANLANGVNLALQAKQAHWNVKGPNFLQLHELFDRAHAQATEWVDLMAERAVQLGGVARGTLEAVSEGTSLAPYDLGLADGPAHVDALSSAVARFGAKVRDAIGAAGDAGDEDTADIFTEISRGADKLLWFIEAHLQSGK